VHPSHKTNQPNWQAIFGQVKRMSLEKIIVGEVCSFKPFIENG
jgi:hypothetical protein